MPLSAPNSVECEEESVEIGTSCPSLHRELLVLISECSYPIPLDQV
jgi:hypothetical protein